MSDSDEQRKARSLASIDHSLKELVKVLVVLNQNFAEVGKSFKQWLDDGGVEVDLSQLIELAKDPAEAAFLRNMLKEGTETN